MDHLQPRVSLSNIEPCTEEHSYLFGFFQLLDFHWKMEAASILALVSVLLTIAHRLGVTIRDAYGLYNTMKGITGSLDLISARNLILRTALNQLKQWCSTLIVDERLSPEVSKALQVASKTCNTVMEGICG